MIGELEEEVNNYVSNFYDKHQTKVKEVMVPDIIDKELMANTFNLNFITPQKGTKKKILDLAFDNAKNYYNEQISLIKKDERVLNDSLDELSKLLNIESCNHIEMFDNAHIFGAFNVSGMVTFIDGKKAPHLYRKFKITNDKNDDYGTMREVIYRRYFRVLKDNLEKPDLILVDCGVGQVNVAREVIASLGLNIPVAGLKKDDKHTTSMLLGRYPLTEIPIKKDSYLFLLLTRMQDEVHRYTITYHKDIRSKGALSSILDNIEGIGEVRKKMILKKYKTIKNMQTASLEELKEIMPENIAINFKEYLKNIE
jgi:excinuclease ABC subunit C